MLIVVVWPDPKTLRSDGTPAYWVLLESSCHYKNNQQIVLRPQRMNNQEKEKRLSTLYLGLLMILDF